MNRLIKTLITFLVFISFSWCATSYAQLKAAFSATPTQGCSPLLVNFKDESTGNPTGWRWDLGNGTISFLRNPSVTYFAAGSYNVKLVVSNASGADSIAKSSYITVNSNPTVSFTGVPTVGCFPLKVQFTDQTIAGSGTIAKYEWDFGDGSISNVANPLHVYTAIGSYTVTLRVTNSTGCTSTITKAQYVKVTVGINTAFTIQNPTHCAAPATVNFQNQSTGSGTLFYQWLFGDGGTSTAVNPSYTYTSPGTYTVKLIVTNSTGCTDTLTKVDAVSIGNFKADFTLTASVCTGVPFTITNTSAPAPVSVLWDFGDGTTSTAINPVKTYITAGNYIIKLTADFGGCIDVVSKSVAVTDPPKIDFSADKTSLCSAPASINFINNSTGGTSYKWYFGDGDSSTAISPAHTYLSTGTYTVTLVVTNASGCTDSLVKPGYIVIQGPTAAIADLPKGGCAPYTHIFQSSSTSVDPIVSYLWNFGDGTTSTQQNPSHTFNVGVYTITLTVTTAGGCSNTIVVDKGISAGTKPTANFSATPRDVCAFKPVFFKDLSLGNPDKWFWDFGDGGTSILQDPEHAYSDTGYFTVRLIVSNGGCEDTLIIPNYIHILPPISGFTVASTCANSALKVFTDKSVGADTWLWDFGDGSTSTLANLSHVYAAAGIYLVTQTVTNTTTGCSHQTSMPVKVISEKADFTADKTEACKGETITFSAVGISPSNVVRYHWNFGDGTDIDGTPVYPHYYTNAGIYTVSLEITDEQGCVSSIQKLLYIKVNGPTADFKTPASGCLNGNVIFSDLSKSDGEHAISQWIWDFGDGTVQSFTAPPFTHIYTAAGSFLIHLKVIDKNSCADSVSKGPIPVSSVTAAFISDTLSCSGAPINFTNQSVGTGLTYKWSFGDGSLSTAINPVHSYAAEGNFLVKVTATDVYGCFNVDSAFIRIANPAADFIMSDSVSNCPPLPVTFTGNPKNGISFKWDFGDGNFSTLPSPTHYYAIAGTFNAVFTVTSPGGCVATKTRKIVIKGPEGSFTYTNLAGCTPLTTNFQATIKSASSFVWDFNDGVTVSSAVKNISHVYTIPGFYLPKIILVDSGGCQVAITGIDTIKVFGAAAFFKLNKNVFCDSALVQFTDSTITNDLITSYKWKFGDGDTSALQNPSHNYTKTGSYIVSLTVATGNGCSSTYTSNLPVKILPTPVVGITSPQGACVPATFNFKGNIIFSDTSALVWKWDFGNGNTATGQNPPPQTYPAAGTYNITAIATNSGGCADTVLQTIQVYPVPNIDATADTTTCRGKPFTLNVSGGNTYTWSPATGLSCTTCQNPSATPDSNIIYFVTGVSAQGCSNKDSVILKVIQPFKVLPSANDSLCIGRSVQLKVSGTDIYTWSPAAGLNKTNIPDPIASPIVSTNYMVVGADRFGCFTDTAFVFIKVNPIPVVNAGNDTTISIGGSAQLMPQISADVTNVQWSPPIGITARPYPGIVVKPTQSTEYTVDVINAGGCRSSDKVMVSVLCNGTNIYVPNTFTPNNDGVNDVFYPRGSGVFSIRSFRIYDRWGELVFENSNFNANDASKGWNGIYKNKQLSPDVFVYTIDVVCENSQVLTLKGNVALIR
ncbi:hypothetical protein BH09BAC2_BH09BAC2_18730 [soil metagenome]